MDLVERKLMIEKRDGLILNLFEEGYNTKQLSVIFNKNFLDVEKILENHGFHLI